MGSDAQYPAHGQMKISEGIEAIVGLLGLLSSAEVVAEALQAMRDGTTDEEWEQIIANPLVDELISACMDLEYKLQ